jgi:anaerobic magnesium-protoporphyrin IX monomethyl ester cyclase
MKILLLNPPTTDQRAFIREGRCNQEQGAWTTQWPPITLATAGAMLETQGHAVTILDCAAQVITRSDLLGRICATPYALIAWATATPSITSDLTLANEIKALRQDTFTAVFGTHVTAMADACLQTTPGLDAVICHEPEATLVDLATALCDHRDLTGVAGISFKDSAGQLVHTRIRPFISDLDSLPFPAWHLVDLECYKLPLLGKRFVILLPLRGCPYSCTFCTAQTYYGNRLRRRSVPRMMEEITSIIKRFDIRNFFIWADTFTVDRTYVMKFCDQLLQQGLAIRWTCNSRVDTIDQEMLYAMAKAGCWMISYGIESGNQGILDAIQKKITVQQSHDAVKMAKQAGLQVAGHFVLGFPGETEETLRETITLAAALDVDIAQFYVATPFPGSELYEHAVQQGWITDQSFEEFSQNHAVMQLPTLPPATVNAYRRKGFLTFYLRPKQLRRMLHLVSSGSLQNTISGGWRFVKWMMS